MVDTQLRLGGYNRPERYSDSIQVHRSLEMTSVNAVMARLTLALLAAIAFTTAAGAQFGGDRGPVVTSPEIKPDRHVTFRLLAPRAEKVGLFTTDIPGGFQPRPLKKGDKGIW